MCRWNRARSGSYACGPTVYNYIHIGNARPICVFDVLRRYLEYRGYEVTFVQNFTDIDDKIINKANEEGITVAGGCRALHRRVQERCRGPERPPGHDAIPRPPRISTRSSRSCPDLMDKGYAYEAKRRRVFPLAASLRTTASCPTSRWRIWKPAAAIDVSEHQGGPAGLRPVEGRQAGRALSGSPPGARAVPAGTLSAPR